MTSEQIQLRPPLGFRAANFADWRGRLDRERIDPVVGIAGTRGKTSTLRILESIFGSGGYRIATWTDSGVEIDGEHQRGELGPWSRAVTRLRAGGLDIALQEIDWSTVPVVGTSSGQYPILALTNFCGNSEACLITPDMLLARRALTRLIGSLSQFGRLILNADDFVVADDDGDDHDRFLVGISRDTPILRRHLDHGGDACWLEKGVIVCQEGGKLAPIVDVDRLAWTHHGNIAFAVQNALMATGIARACGIDADVVAAGLEDHQPLPERLPGSFNVFDTGSGAVVVDVPVPSWFLRTTLRAAAEIGAGRQIRVAGPMLNVETDDLSEVGRLLGRGGGIIILHGLWDAVRLDAVRQGVAANEVPPLIIQAVDERSAIQQGLDMLRAADVMLVLAEQPATVVKIIDRRVRRQPRSMLDATGAA